MTYNHEDECWQDIQKSAFVWWNRLAKFYPTAFLVVFVSGLLAPFGGLRDRLTLENAVANIFLLQAWNMNWNFSEIVWFLSVLVFCYACFPVLNGWMERHGNTLPILISVFLWGASVAIVHQRSSLASLVKAFPPLRVYEFVLGMVVCKALFRGRRLRRNAHRLIRGYVFSLIGLLYVCVVLLIQSRIGFSKGGAYTAWTPGSLALLAGFSILPFRLESSTVGRLFKFFVSISFSFFMFHLIVLRCFHLFLRLSGHEADLLFDIVFFGVALVCTTGLAWMWTRYVLPSLTKGLRNRNPFRAGTVVSG